MGIGHREHLIRNFRSGRVDLGEETGYPVAYLGELRGAVVMEITEYTSLARFFPSG